ncbi:MAG TPA: phosphatase PAP2 family protein [Thermoanaerobaculia bacterium]|nr:phosphatase PAP2 family protein [Thermoanaerobaculia bacterium]
MIQLPFFALFLILWAVLYAAAPALRHLSMIAAERLTRITLRSAVLQRIAAHAGRFRDYVPVALVIAAGGLLAAWAGDAFIDIAELVRSRSETLRAFDVSVQQWAKAHRSDDATSFFAAVTFIGGPAGLAIVVAGAIAVLALFHRYRWAVYLALTTLGGGLINIELKRSFARARPEVAEMIRQSHGYAFPSGHAMGATVAAGALTYLAFRALQSWSARAAAAAFAATFVLAVALSRVYLGVHWISDVAGGVTAGLIWVAVTTVSYEAVRRIRLLRAMRKRAR